MNPKIFVNASFLAQPITGAQRFAIELSLGLKQHFPDIIFLAPKNIIHTHLAEVLGVKTFGISTNKVIWEHLDLPLFLHSQKKKPLLINLCNMAPLIYSNNLIAILDLAFLRHKEWFSNIFSLYYNFVVPIVSKRAKRVITISENTKLDIIKILKIPSNKIEIVYPSIAESFKREYTSSSALKYNNYILAVSSLDPRKNFKRLIEAFKQCKLADTKLVIVGDAYSVFANSDIKALAVNDSSIVFTGYVTDEELITLYRGALFFAYPSLFEGFGLPPLEAMACGCPTLVSNTTSLPEVCGDASLYVDPMSVDDICRGLTELAEDSELRKELIIKGYERLALFERTKSVQKMAEIIQQVVRNQNN